MILYKKKTKVICKDCGKELFVRNDYLKTHKGRCQRCAKKHDWTKEEYVRKCSESHKGNIPTEEQRKKQSETLKKLPMTKKRLEQINKIAKDRALPNGMASAKWAYRNKIRAVKLRGREFNLTFEQYYNIVIKDCVYCGVRPNQITKPHDKINGSFIHNGIDRVNNDFGYEIDNCVPCCRNCNTHKRFLSVSEFKSKYPNVFILNIECDTLGSRTEYTK